MSIKIKNERTNIPVFGITPLFSEQSIIGEEVGIDVQTGLFTPRKLVNPSFYSLQN